MNLPIKSMCSACLSPNRKLHPIQDLTFFASLTLLQVSDRSYLLCWECNTIFNKAKLFRRKALKAQAVLCRLEQLNFRLSNMGWSKLLNVINIPPQLVSKPQNYVNEEFIIKEQDITLAYNKDLFEDSEISGQVTDDIDYLDEEFTIKETDITVIDDKDPFEDNKMSAQDTDEIDYLNEEFIIKEQDVTLADNKDPVEDSEMSAQDTDDINYLNEELTIKETDITVVDDKDPFEDREICEQEIDYLNEEYDSSDNETLSDRKKENMSYIEIKHQPAVRKVLKVVLKPITVSKVSFPPKPGQSIKVPVSKQLNIKLPALIQGKKEAKDKIETVKNNQKEIDKYSKYILKELSEEDVLEFRRVKLEKLIEKNGKKLRCDKCILTFISVPAYESHMNRHSESAGAFQCKICEVRFQTKLSMKTHLDAHYRIYQCQSCKEECLSLPEFLRHFEKTSVECTQCGESFRNKRALRQHKQRRHGTRAPCAVCNKMINTAFMKPHLDLHKPQPALECDVCHKLYYGMWRLKLHKHQAHKPLEVVDGMYCVECKLAFKNVYTYKLHMTRSPKHVRKENQQQCPHCDKKFSCDYYLNGHINRMHTEQPGVDCDQCKNKFHNKMALKRHIHKVHEKRVLPRDKVCEICGKAFFVSGTLRQHMFSHNNIRPYKCEFCGDTFSFSGARYTHIKLKHKKQADREDKKKQAGRDDKKMKKKW